MLISKLDPELVLPTTADGTCRQLSFIDYILRDWYKYNFGIFFGL